MGYPRVLSSQAEADVLDERERQVCVERWSAEHDDQHTDGSLVLAAVCYATFAVRPFVNIWNLWPRSWSPDWWKPKDPRRDLVRAAALIIAEIERLDRAEARAKAEASHG